MRSKNTIEEREWRGFSPVAVCIAFVLSTIALALKFHPPFNLLIFACTQLLLLLERVPLKKIASYLALQLLLAVTIFFTGYYYSPAAHDVGQGNWMGSGAWNGLQLSSRALAFAGLGIFFALTMDRVALIESAIRQLGVPRKVGYSVLAAGGIFPKLQEEHRKVKLAMMARGVPMAAFSPLTIKIMLVKAVRWSDHLALAMISKGFTDHGPMTTWKIYRWRIRDFLLMILMPLFVVVILHFWKL